MKAERIQETISRHIHLIIQAADAPEKVMIQLKAIILICSVLVPFFLQKLTRLPLDCALPSGRASLAAACNADWTVVYKDMLAYARTSTAASP